MIGKVNLISAAIKRLGGSRGLSFIFMAKMLEGQFFLLLSRETEFKDPGGASI